MNIPLDADGTVQFNATFVAVVTTALNIYTDGNADNRSSKLRRAIQLIWKRFPSEMIDQVIPSGCKLFN